MLPRGSEFEFLDASKPIRLYNVVCLYCGTAFGVNEKRIAEHVIAKRFVPRGRFDGQWNLIVNACARCNTAKSDLESEVSAVTMQPDAWGRHPENDSHLAREASRKARSVKNSRTGKLIRAGDESMDVELPVVPGVTFRASFTGAAQLAEGRAYHLAWYHIAAFFYLITYKQERRRGVRWPGEFMPLMVVRESDWGNSLMRTFQDLVGPWDHRFYATLPQRSVVRRRRAD